MSDFHLAVFRVIICLNCFFYAMFFMQHNQKETSSGAFASAQFWMGVWNLMEALKVFISDYRYAAVLQALQHIATEFSSATFLLFSWSYSLSDKQRNLKIRYAILSVPLFMIAVFVYMLFTHCSPIFTIDGHKTVFNRIHDVYSFTVSISAAILLVKRCITDINTNGRRYMIISSAAVAFLIALAALFFIHNYRPAMPRNDMSLFLLICTFLLVNLSFVAMYTDENETVLSQCYENLFELTSYPLYIFNSKNQFLAANTVGREMLESDGTKVKQFMQYEVLFPSAKFSRLGVPQDRKAEKMFYLSNIETGNMYLCTKENLQYRYSKKTAGFYFSMFDLDSYNILLKNIEATAYTDQLTGCYNGSFFFMNMHVEMKSTHEEFILLEAGLDNLSEINGILGHAAGDEYVVKTAEILGSLLQEQKLYRMESSTFAAMLPRSQLLLMPELFGKIRASAARYSKSKTCPLSISAGYAIVDDRDTDVSVYYATALSNMLLDRKGHSSRNLSET